MSVCILTLNFRLLRGVVDVLVVWLFIVKLTNELDMCHMEIRTVSSQLGLVYQYGTNTRVRVRFGWHLNKGSQTRIINVCNMNLA